MHRQRRWHLQPKELHHSESYERNEKSRVGDTLELHDWRHVNSVPLNMVERVPLSMSQPEYIAKTVPDWGIDCESSKCGSENGKSACWFFVLSSDVA
jgi:hypothetical protein